MKKINATLLTVLSLIIISGIIFNNPSFASPLTATRDNHKTTHTGIPKLLLRDARTFGETTVLNKTQGELKAILLSHSLNQVLAGQGLDPKTFREDVRAEISSYLLSKGYSQSQITAALNSKYIKSHRNNI